MEEIFKELYELYNKDVYLLAYSYTQNKFDAEDITQKVFIKIYKKISNVKLESAKALLLTITTNECKNLLLSPWKKMRTSLIEKEINSNDKNDDDNIKLILNNIPKKYRICIHLYYFYGYKIKEIAKIVKLKEETVKTRLSRGRKILKKEMEKYENG